MLELIHSEKIEAKIFQIRGKNVMLDEDLASLYGVETKQLKRQVRRHIERFPDDFMFELTRKEYRDLLRCQFGTLEIRRIFKISSLCFYGTGCCYAFWYFE